MTEGPKPEKRETLLGFPIEYVEGVHPFGGDDEPFVLGESLLAEWRVGDVFTINSPSLDVSGRFEVVEWDRAANVVRLRKVGSG